MDISDQQIDELLIEGKTKRVFNFKCNEMSDLVYITNKDNISAGDNSRNRRIMEGKGRITIETSSSLFKFLNDIGVQTAFVSKVTNSDNSFIAKNCKMIPIEIVIRRIATGTYIKLNPDVEEGFRFKSPEIEIHIKDDANHDPLWSKQTLIDKKFIINGLKIDKTVIEMIFKISKLVFEILEKIWKTIDYHLIDLKVEFGVICDNNSNKSLILADIIDNETWRLWPKGDKRLMVDKQIYREYKEGEVNEEILDYVKSVFQKVSDLTQDLFDSEKYKSKYLNKELIFVLINCQNCMLLAKDFEKQLERDYGINCVKTVKVDEMDDNINDIIDGLNQSCCEVIVTIGLKKVQTLIEMKTTVPIIEYTDNEDMDNVKENICLKVAKILAKNDSFIWSKIKTIQCYNEIENQFNI